MKIMVWNAARGGMRSVVETYRADGFLEQEGVTLVHSYVDGGFMKRQLVLAGALAKFVWLLATRPVTLVHCHAAMRGSFWRKSLFARLARLRGIPVLFHLHGSEMKLFYGRQPAGVQRMIARELSRADSVLVLSESWRTFIAKIAPAAHPVIVPNYVRVPPAVERATKPTVDVLFLGLLGPRKGIYDLLNAFEVAFRSAPELRLKVGGNGEIERACAEATRLGLEGHVEFLGWIEGARREVLLAEADIFVLPSHNEGLPMSVLEAMASGLPVITTRVGGLPELITDEVDGLLIDPGDRAALARALVTLGGDAVHRERLGRAARARVLAGYSGDIVLGRLHDLYRSTAKPTGSGGALVGRAAPRT